MKSSTKILLGVLAVVAIGGLAWHFNSSSPSTTPEVAGISPTSSPSVVASPETQGASMPNLNTAPDLSVDANGLSKTAVVMKTSQGVIKFRFYPGDAPETVKRIIELVQTKFYNGLTFHRVIDKFVAQTGDPLGNGTGGSGKRLRAEFNKRQHVEGTVAMARAADPDSADSQFYICLGRLPHLDGKYTVFGQVTEGMDVVAKIRVGDKIEAMALE